MPEGGSNVPEGGSNQQQIWKELLVLAKDTSAAATKAASVKTFLNWTIPIIAAALGTLFIQNYNLNRNVGELGVTVENLKTAITGPDGLTASINSLAESQTELNTTVGTLRTSVDDLKKKL